MNRIIALILTSVALGTGVGTLVLNLISEIDVRSSIILLSISITCLAIVKLQKN